MREIRIRNSARDVELAVKMLVSCMSDALAAGQRIEIRGFGSFTLRVRHRRIVPDPGTEETAALQGRYEVHFRPGKALRDRVNAAFAEQTDEAVQTDSARDLAG